MRGEKRRTGILIAVALSAAWGCGGGGGGAPVKSSTDTKVTGMLKINGKPAAGAQVAFNPANSERPSAWPPRTAQVQADGSFQLWTLPGDNTVTVTGTGAAADPKVAEFKKVVNVSGSLGPVNLELP